jgi:glycosyltransferase involved in cell wall biosynthesis
MKTLQVACLTPYQPNVGASTRYRIGQYVPLLEQAGIQVRMVPFASPQLQHLLYQPGKTLAKIAALVRSTLHWLPQALQHTDLVFVQREAALIGPPLVERWLSRHYPVIYDFDDAIFLNTYAGVNRRWARYARPANKTPRLLQLSTTVLAGNRYLAAYSRQHNPNVHRLPTTVDCDLLQPNAHPAPTLVRTLGWIGSPTTTPYLTAILPALERLARLRQFRLLIVGAARTIEIAGVECINLPWELQREASDFQALDIGLYPLPESEWALGKCALKAIQYGAVGIPTVCSPIGMNTEVVINNATGLYASSLDEWVSALTRLLDDTALRGRLGAAGRQRILEHYELRAHASQLVSILHDTIRRYHQSGA